jgi:hypothetical protein
MTDSSTRDNLKIRGRQYSKDFKIGGNTISKRDVSNSTDASNSREPATAYTITAGTPAKDMVLEGRSIIEKR